MRQAIDNLLFKLRQTQEEKDHILQRFNTMHEKQTSSKRSIERTEEPEEWPNKCHDSTREQSLVSTHTSLFALPQEQRASYAQQPYSPVASIPWDMPRDNDMDMREGIRDTINWGRWQYEEAITVRPPGELSTDPLITTDPHM